MESKDNKNAILAVVLSGIILFGWNYFFAPQPYEQAETRKVSQPNINNLKDQKADATTPVVKPKTMAMSDKNFAEEKIYTFENDKILIKITNRLNVVSINDKKTNTNLSDIFKKQIVSLKINSVESPLFIFSKIDQDTYKISYPDLQLAGMLNLNDDGSLSVKLNSSAAFTPQIDLTSQEDALDDATRVNNFIYLGDGLQLNLVGSEDAEHSEFKFKWFGLDFKYHLYAFVMEQENLIKLETRNNTLKAATINKVNQFDYKIVFLKKNYDELISMGHNLELAVDFGIWAIIAVPILRGLQYFYDIFRNYGIAIIVLTIVMRLLTFPLQYKSFKSMKKMQVIQPELKEIKEKFKDNPQKVQLETMALFKKAGANPLGGCLPMLLQMPVFFAFYKVLFTSVELVNAPFYLWITDLSEKDPFYVLPVLMGLAMFLNMKLTPNTSVDPAQQKVMMFMPVIFSIFMINLPAGLTLYILVSTIAGMLQQLFVYKRTT
jgi:YidC/Oxa1 family membrane protein insertase